MLKSENAEAHFTGTKTQHTFDPHYKTANSQYKGQISG